MRLRLALVLVLWVPAVAARAETLAEASERARQQEPKTGSPRVFTNEDLHREQPAARPTPKDGTPAPGPAEPGATPSPNPTPEPPSESAVQREQWRQRALRISGDVETARSRVASAQQALDAAISPFNTLTPRGLGNPEVPAMREALAKAKADLADAEKQLADFQEEARRAGIPPGWIQNP